jgi:hypothetical protein
VSASVVTATKTPSRVVAWERQAGEKKLMSPCFKPLRHAEHRRALHLQDEGYAQARNQVRKTRPELPKHGILVRYQMLGELSPDPKLSGSEYEA